MLVPTTYSILFSRYALSKVRPTLYSSTHDHALQQLRVHRDGRDLLRGEMIWRSCLAIDVSLVASPGARRTGQHSGRQSTHSSPPLCTIDTGPAARPLNGRVCCRSVGIGYDCSTPPIDQSAVERRRSLAVHQLQANSMHSAQGNRTE